VALNDLARTTRKKRKGKKKSMKISESNLLNSQFKIPVLVKLGLIKIGKDATRKGKSQQTA